MRERPILFKPELVRATLDGKKCQTRRVIKPQPKDTYCWETPCGECADNDMCSDVPFIPEDECPYGKVGDILWVRETWCEEEYYVPGSDRKEIKVYYKADWLDLEHIKVVAYTHDNLEEGVELKRKWKPSIHMPKKYCRLRLRITDIRVERIQDISEEDCKAEGVEKAHLEHLGQTWKTYKEGFRILWDAINKKRGFAWESNPYVWIIEYEVLQ